MNERYLESEMLPQKFFHPVVKLSAWLAHVVD